MSPELEKAKQILKKHFCFMEWQENDAKEAGRPTMNKEDIGFLLSLDGLTKEETLHTKKEPKTLEEILLMVEKAKQKGLNGVVFFNTTIPCHEELRKYGYFIRMEGHGSFFWDEIYLSEETFIRAEISYFKNFFSNLTSAHSSGLI